MSKARLVDGLPRRPAGTPGQHHDVVPARIVRSIVSGDRDGGRGSGAGFHRAVPPALGGSPRSGPTRSRALAENRRSVLSGRYRQVDSISPGQQGRDVPPGRQRHPVSHRHRATTARRRRRVARQSVSSARLSGTACRCRPGARDLHGLGTHLRVVRGRGAVCTAVCRRGVVAVSRLLAADRPGKPWLARGDPGAALRAAIPGRTQSAPDTASRRTGHGTLARTGQNGCREALYAFCNLRALLAVGIGGLGEAPLRILTQTGNSNPLQRRPAVGRIPLLARILRRRNDAPLLEELLANGRGDRVRLLPGGRLHEQRIQGCRRNSWHPNTLCPVIVEIRSGRRIPQVTVHGRAPLVRTTLELPHAGLIDGALAGGANGLLEAEQQAVEIDGNYLGGDDRGARVCIGEPARAEIPAAFRRRADVAVNLLRVAPAGARQLGVMPIRFVPWAVAVVPVAVEQRAVGKSHHAPVRRTGSQAPRAFHPAGVLAPELPAATCPGIGWVVPSA